ncbi:hypothetical protein ACIBG0_10505 [Nocardia sp. NPDC050630]
MAEIPKDLRGLPEEVGAIDESSPFRLGVMIDTVEDALCPDD